MLNGSNDGDETLNDKIIDQAQEVANNFAGKWGIFRRWISKNPLSGFWSGVGVGVVGLIGIRIVGRLLGFAASLIF